ncbi:HNH endonuclease [Yinghuangia seranimata]|uniref:HNH endonuclease n=1 Tax=Yinghuangia seranimata TaxID=408067 RepID=UPI00248CFC6B|nr:HNH endonuclease [Yinghuangia seranimata]MDI2125174.1 hypothetical protein [Yinghuangia seranimata]
MIPLRRPVLPAGLAARIELKSEELRSGAATTRAAREAWKAARLVRAELGGVLGAMASGLERCMYCGDSAGSSIDHFEPIVRAPLRAFDWLNHLLACTHCNSNHKRDQYPCDDTGACLLVDPSREDPYDHLRLTLSTGEYRAVTPKGAETIRVFGLGRRVLCRGREMAYPRCKSMLRDAVRQHAEGRDDIAREVEQALLAQPFADVLYAMYRTLHTPGAAAVFEPDVLDALRRVRLFAPPAGARAVVVPPRAGPGAAVAREAPPG